MQKLEEAYVKEGIDSRVQRVSHRAHGQGAAEIQEGTETRGLQVVGAPLIS